MFQGWRLKLREAEEALRHGRLEEAGQLLCQGELREFLPGKRLGMQVAQHMAERARRRLVDGNTSAGWRDLEQAQTLSGNSEEVQAVRREMIDLALEDVAGLIEAGATDRALQQIDKLERRQVQLESLRTLREVAQKIDCARHLSQRGRFGDAESELQTAARLRPDLKSIEAERAVCHEQLEKARRLTHRMHRAMAGQDWTRTLAMADRLLEICPDNKIARDARAEAWAKVGANVSSRRTRSWMPPARAAVHAEGDSVPNKQLGPRFLLWVDAVGGYLVCQSDDILIGQAVPENHIAVPILADLSRRHARIRRTAESYVLEALAPVRVGGQRVADRTLLSDGDELELGDGVRFRFRQPHALSATARLEFLSRHKSQPTADGILLMAESCVLGPHRQNHVVCRDWSSDVVLYRQDGQLYCRAMDSVEIDGQLFDGRGPVGLSSRVVGADFSLSLEEI